MNQQVEGSEKEEKRDFLKWYEKVEEENQIKQKEQ